MKGKNIIYLIVIGLSIVTMGAIVFMSRKHEAEQRAEDFPVKEFEIIPTVISQVDTTEEGFLEISYSYSFRDNYYNQHELIGEDELTNFENGSPQVGDTIWLKIFIEKPEVNNWSVYPPED